MQPTVLACSLALLTPVLLAAQDDARLKGVVLHAEGASPGYTLVAPLRSKGTFLIDMEGETVHTWPCELRPGNSVYLLDDGSLLRCCRVSDNPTFSGGGQGGAIQRIAWDGTLLWNYVHSSEDELQHHDIEPLPNGNVLLITWERVSRAAAVAAGRDPAHVSEQGLWPDAVVEVRPTGLATGDVVWRWRAWDHLVQDFDPALPNYGDVAAHPQRIDVNGDRRESPPTAAELQAQRELEERLAALGYGGGDDDEDDERGRGDGRGNRPDWLHTNAIDYNAERDEIVLSLRNWSEVWVIDHGVSTEEARGPAGDLLYRFGNPQRHGARGEQALYVQHDAQWVPPGHPGAGNLLVFNNGEGRPGTPPYSSVDEFAPPLDDDGRYVLEPGMESTPPRSAWTHGDRGAGRFYSGHISGAQRLPNGNTLICSGEDGRVFEVTPAGDVVWDWYNPFEPDATDEGAPRDRRRGRGGASRPDGPPGGRGPGGRGTGGRGPGGRGQGPGDPRALFRVTRIAADHPGLAALVREDE